MWVRGVGFLVEWYVEVNSWTCWFPNAIDPQGLRGPLMSIGSLIIGSIPEDQRLSKPLGRVKKGADSEG